MKPFRWNLKKREQLGKLLDIEAGAAYGEYTEQLAQCASRVVARSANKKIVFVGRSPENIFDYLSGVFHQTGQENKIAILNISNRFEKIDDIKSEFPGAYDALKAHFTELGLSPRHIVSDPAGVCFCDLVAWGGTFERLFEFMQKWALEEKADFPAMSSKLIFLGITQRTKNSPNTWRWQQNADWIMQHPKLTIKNISIPVVLWDYLGNTQGKVAKTNPPDKWDDSAILLPPRERGNLKALKQAYQIYSLGLEHKKSFAEALSSTQEIKQAWLRSLVNELKQL